MKNNSFKELIYNFIPVFKIPSVTRLSLYFELKRQIKRLKSGVVLEVASGRSSYKKFISHTKYLTLDSVRVVALIFVAMCIILSGNQTILTRWWLWRFWSIFTIPRK